MPPIGRYHSFTYIVRDIHVHLYPTYDVDQSYRYIALWYSWLLAQWSHSVTTLVVLLQQWDTNQLTSAVWNIALVRNHIQPSAFVLVLYVAILAQYYVVAKVYKVLYMWYSPSLWDSCPYYTVPEGQGKHSYSSWHICCIHGNNGLENSYWLIPRSVCNIEALIHRDLCFYTAYKPQELIGNYYLHSCIIIP